MKSEKILKFNKSFIIISVTVNIILLTFFSYFLFKKNGIRYITERAFSKAIIKNPNYYERKSLFEILPNSKNEIIFLGSSKTERCEWAELFQDARIKNRGIGGDTTEGVLLRMDEIVESLPQKVFIMIGSNDLKYGVNIPAIITNYKKLVEVIISKSPNTRIYIQSVLPINDEIVLKNRIYPCKRLNENIVKLNGYLREISSYYNIRYINLWNIFAEKNRQLRAEYTGDGIHLNGQAYIVWKSIIEKYVLEN